MGAIPDIIAPRNNEIIAASTESTFASTDLAMILRANDIDSLVLFGIATSGVVLSTLTEAADADYRLATIGDCCADLDSALHDCLIQRFFPTRGAVLSAEVIGASSKTESRSWNAASWCVSAPHWSHAARQTLLNTDHFFLTQYQSRSRAGVQGRSMMGNTRIRTGRRTSGSPMAHRWAYHTPRRRFRRGKAMATSHAATRRSKAFLARAFQLLSIFRLLFPLQMVALNLHTRISQYGHSSWKIQDGYFGNQPIEVTQTTDGYLWVETKGGIFQRFDGVFVSMDFIDRGKAVIPTTGPCWARGTTFLHRNKFRFTDEKTNSTRSSMPESG